MEEKRKNGFIGLVQNDFYNLNCRVITKIETQLGYLQVLEYTLQDFSYLHVVQWHFNDDLEKETFIPKSNCKSFYREKDKAMKLAQEIGNNLLQQYDLA